MPARSSQYAEDWRGRSSRPSPRSLRLARLVATTIVLFFLACLIGLIVWLWDILRVPTLHIACLPLDEFHALVADPIAFARLDAEALRDVCKTDDKTDDNYYCAPPNSDAEEVRAKFLGHLRDCKSDVLVCAVWARPLSDSPELVFACSDLQDDPVEGGQPARGSKTLPLRSLLEALAASPAKQKILVLDAGRGLSTPHGGMPILNLADRVKTELDRFRQAEGSIWVLLANSSQEQTHVLPAKQRSAFFHFLTEAMQGEADGVMGQKDQQIDLAEVYEYVRQHVSGWVWSQSSEARTQTPVLLPAGADSSPGKASQVVMRILPRPRAKPAPEQEGGAKTEADKSEAAARKPPSAATNGRKSPQPKPTDGSEPKQVPGAAPSPPSGESSPKTTASMGTGKEPSAPQPGQAAKPEIAAKSEPAADRDSARGRPQASEIDKLLANPVARFANLKDILRRHWSARYQPLSSCADLETELVAWTPVDYAPHLVRRFEESLISYQGRAISVPLVSPGQPAPKEVERSSAEVIALEVAGLDRDREADFCRVAKTFRGSETQSNWSQSDVLRSVIQVRNEAMFELPYYIRLQTQLPAGVSQQDYYEGVHMLIQRLERLIQALDSRILKRAGAGGLGTQFTVLLDAGANEADVEVLAGYVREQREGLRRILGLTDRDGSRRKDPLFLFDLLATPLVAPVERAQIWSQLLAAAREDWPDGTSSPPAVAQVLESQQRARNQLVHRAQLELEALALTCSEGEERVQWEQNREQLQVALRKDDAALAETLVQVGQQIRRRAIALVQRVPGVDGAKPTARGEVALRLLPAWLADEVEGRRSRLVPIAAPLECCEIQARLVFTPPAGSEQGPLPLSPQETTFHWNLSSSAKAIPPRLKLIFDYPEDSLRVTRQGRVLRGAVDWLTDGEAAREERSLAIQVRPLKEDGSKARLTITLPDDGGLRAAADFQLPEPTLLDLSVAGRVGTFAGDFRAPAPDAERKDDAARWLQFDPSGFASVTLRPYPSAPASYIIAARNSSPREWSVTSTVWTIPAELRQRGGREFRPWEASSTTPPPGYIVQSKNKWTIRAGETTDLPLFPLPPAAAAEPAAKPADAPPAKQPAPVPDSGDVTGGMLCLLELPKARQLLWIDVQTQHPEAYLQPEVDYDSAEQRIQIRLKASNPEMLPPGNCRVRWEIPPELRNRIVEGYQPPEIDLRSAAPAVLSARLTVDPAVQRSVPVVISVDGYPRAFEYERPLSIGAGDRKVTSRLNAQVLLYEVDEKGDLQRDDRGNFVQVPPNKGFSRLERIGVVFRADTPPAEAVDSDFRLRVLLRGMAASGGNAAVGESREFFRDRDFSVKLEKPESAPGFVLRSRVDELTAVLRTASFQNQEIVVRGEIERRPRNGGKPVLVKFDEQSVWHDDRPPKVLELRTNRITEGESLAVDVSEDPTGVAELWHAWALDPAGKLLEPKKAQRQQGTKALATFLVSSEGLKPPEHALYLAATDGAGNTAEPTRHVIQVVAAPPKPEPAKPMPEPKKIIGSVTYDGRGVSGLSVTLTPPNRPETTSGGQGKFEFDDLPPGKYQVQVKPQKVQGVTMTAEKRVDLTGPEPSATVDLQLVPK